MRLIQSLTFPRAILPISSTLRESLAQIPVLGVLLVFLLATGARPTWSWLLVPVAYALQVLFNAGAAFLAGRATFHFRDMEQLLPFVLRLWFYVSGVFFTADRIPAGWARTLFEANPVYAFIALNRELLLQGGAAPALWGRAGAWAVALVAVGFVFFQRREGEYGRGW
jgi:teichoic acid transport system permease protein